MNKKYILPLAEVKKDVFTIKKIGKLSVGVILINGEVKCFLNSCPHAGAPVCRGKVTRAITGNRDNKVLSETWVVKCPWHGWEFNLEDGKSYLGGLGKIISMKTVVEDGKVYVMI